MPDRPLPPPPLEATALPPPPAEALMPPSTALPSPPQAATESPVQSLIRWPFRQAGKLDVWSGIKTPTQAERRGQLYGDVWPYFLLSRLPGGLATWQAIVGGAAGRALGAGAIGALEQAPAPLRTELAAATEAAKQQLIGEVAVPPVAALASRTAMLGMRAYDKLSDRLVGEVMDRIKTAVPWFGTFSSTQKGFYDFLTKDGIATLRREYGNAFRGVMGDALQGQKIPLTPEDVRFLGLEARSGPFPQSGSLLVDADQALLAANEKGGSEVGELVQDRVVAAVSDLRQVLRETNPAAAERIQDAVSGQALAQEKRWYAEGMNLIQALRSLKAIQRGRFDPETAIKRIAQSRGVNEQMLWERYLTESKAPEARQILARLERQLPPDVERITMPFGSMMFAPHAGRIRLGEHLPFSMYVRGLPHTPAEREAIHRISPTVAGALLQGIRRPAPPTPSTQEER